MENTRSVPANLVHLVTVILIGFPIGIAYAQNNVVEGVSPRHWVNKPVGPLRGVVARDVFHFVWSRDQILKIESTPDRMRWAGGAATIEESRMVLGNTAIRSRSLTIFFAQDEAADGVKAITEGIDALTIWKVEARDVMIRTHDQIATGGSFILDFRTGAANLNDNVAVSQGHNLVRGERLLFDLRTGTSRLEGPKFWRVY